MLLFTGGSKSMGNIKKATTKKEAEKSIFGPALSIFGLPVDRNLIFSNHKGAYRKRIEKRQRKLIVKISFLKFFLHSDENIILLTTGYTPVSIWEMLLTFPTYLFFKRALFVFTTKRIFHIPTSFNHAYRQSITQIRYADCHKLSLKGRSMVLNLKNGECRKFMGIGGAELKKIKFLAGHLPIEEGINPNIEINALCPSCTNPIPDDLKACPKCQIRFKDKYKATLRSILIPGGGFFYSRHPIYGTLMGIMEAIILSAISLSGLRLVQEFSHVNIFVLLLAAIVMIGVKAINGYHTTLLLEFPLPEKTNFERRKI